MRTLQQIFIDAGYETMSYSGAAMYGTKCLAVTFDGHVGRLFSSVLDALVLRGEPGDMGPELALLSKAFRGMRQDALGRDMVVYFPDGSK